MCIKCDLGRRDDCDDCDDDVCEDCGLKPSTHDICGMNLCFDCWERGMGLD